MKKEVFLVIFFWSAFVGRIAANERDSLFKILYTVPENKRAQIYNALGKFYYSNYQLDSAKGFTNKAYALATKYRNQEQLAESMLNYGNIFYYNCQSKRGIEYIKKAAQIFNNIGLSKSYAICLNDQALMNCDLGNYSEALSLFSQAIRINQLNNSIRAMVKNYINAGLTYYSILEYPNAMKLYQKAADLAISNHYNELLPVIWNNIGSVQSGWGRHDSAIFYYQKGLKLIENHDDQANIANAYNNIGYEYLIWKKYDEALEFFNLSYTIDKRIQYKMNIISDLNNIGLVYFNLSQYSSAEKYFQKGYKLAKDIQSPYYSALSIGNLCKVYAQVGNHKRALEYSASEVKIIESYSLKELMLKAYQRRGSIYAQIKDFDEAIRAYHKSYAMAIAKQQRDDIMNSCKLLSEAFKAKGVADSALRYLELYNSLKDSIFSAVQHRQIAEFEVLFGVDRQKKQIRYLSSVNQAKGLLVRNQKIWLAVLFVGLCSLTIAFVFIITAFRRNKQTSEFLKLQYEQLFVQLEQWEVNRDISKSDIIKYRNSQLTQDDVDAIFTRLLIMFGQVKIYLDPDLTMPSLAEKLEVLPQHLSQAINQKMNQNFNDFINYYRVEEVKKRLLDPQFNNLTIEAIGKSVGFNSKTTFIKAFKKFEQCFPSEYRKQNKIML